MCAVCSMSVKYVCVYVLVCACVSGTGLVTILHSFPLASPNQNDKVMVEVELGGGGIVVKWQEQGR